ncbi:tRNA1Val (adenine37-N6)-methyltransferase [Reichenbachiella faecimaris]|uniref:tRNA1(Val) (adenine(37)-N6)-methyltransferase n=1 Tax=Reichenbachiella faecimaris TaxID=692418 RepID=A0A1W2G9Q1_REIFA|nr:methyltransferase [Reichenbachiella faecimaris]SMD33254.1 tRNA1Val (adenine37-N6)-methyltransferase [Reichenbachiella faecimaris]
MPNSYFQFKKFTVHQGQCAMKVSTEACILGAWVPDTQAKRILDIGTGTGLLAMMLAQRIEVPIEAVELDAKAAEQARQNILESKWADRIQVINQNIFEWAKSTDLTYDLIVSNPPFFTNSLKSDQSKNNLAKHDTMDFDKANLALVLKSLLTEKGRAYILYPELESEQFRVEVERNGLRYAQALVIRNQPYGPIFRIISKVSKAEHSISSEELNIREGQLHSKKFNRLLKGYYLKL